MTPMTPEVRVLELPDAAGLAAREAALRERAPAELGPVLLHPTGAVYSVTLQGPWVERASPGRWQRWVRRHADAFGFSADVALVDAQLDGHHRLGVSGVDDFWIDVDGARAELINKAAFRGEPAAAVATADEVAAPWVGRPLHVRWQCARPVPVGCPEPPAPEVRPLERRELEVRELVVGVCASPTTVEVRRIWTIALLPREPNGDGWRPVGGLPRIAVDAVTGEDLSDRAWLGHWALESNPCR